MSSPSSMSMVRRASYFSPLTSVLQFLNLISLFIYHEGGFRIYVLVYVDDIIATWSSPAYVTQLIVTPASRFSLKDLGPLIFFWCWNLSYLWWIVHVSKKYVIDLLRTSRLLSINYLSLCIILVLPIGMFPSVHWCILKWIMDYYYARHHLLVFMPLLTLTRQEI